MSTTGSGKRNFAEASKKIGIPHSQKLGLSVNKGEK